MHDVVGVRVITHLKPDVRLAADAFEREFDINWPHSVDKSELLDVDQFGYASIHYVARLSAARRSLPEYAPFAGIYFELQVRSILQHAWAEIEHDLGYKSAVSVPRPVRRGFSRLASLLELADDEFTRLRDELARYALEVASQTEVEKSSLGLDRQTAEQYLRTNSMVRDMDHRLSEDASVRFNDEFEISVSDSEINHLKELGVQTVEDLHLSLQRHANDVVGFGAYYLAAPPDGGEMFDDDDGFVTCGISVFYLVYVLALLQGREKMLSTRLDESGIPIPFRGEDFADRLRQQWQIFKGQSASTTQGEADIAK